MKRLYHLPVILFCIGFGLLGSTADAQNKPKRNVSLKDSLDHAVDLSDYMIYSNGFVLVPTIITEPSLGGIGGAVASIFLKKRASLIDTVKGKVRITRINPDITGGLAMYTGNKSWLVGLFRSGTFVKPRITYQVAAAYGDLNLSFYRTLQKDADDQQFNFNFKMTPIYLQALKMFRNAKWSAGGQYLFTSITVAARGQSLPAFVADKEKNSLISQAGGIIKYDSRDNIFTPDKGIRVETNFFWSNTILGSDFNSWRINYSGIGYVPLSPKFIGGLRIEGKQSLGSPPFYGLPYINLRGVPAMRYQGNATLLSEIETRWDFYKRWSAVFFGGTGAAYDNWNNMFEKPLVYSYGSGFRYLIARKFKLRMGVDVARGPEEWAYYVVFGSSWFR
ncbi:BamA/TamA family outer membrane protein [Mucilaginibacter sp. AW1-3]